MERRRPPVVFIVLIVAFVFAQLMGAVHACQVGLAPGAPTKASIAADASADCCDSGQTAPDAACDNHCQLGDKAPERVQPSATMPVVAMAFALPAAMLPQPNAPPRSHLSPDLARHIEPALAIRNCCFRI